MALYYNLTLHVKVTNEALLYEAAKRQAIKDGIAPADVDHYLKMDGGAICVRDCLRMLLDPGASPDGVEILDTTVE